MWTQDSTSKAERSIDGRNESDAFPQVSPIGAPIGGAGAPDLSLRVDGTRDRASFDAGRHTSERRRRTRKLAWRRPFLALTNGKEPAR